jgi:hypothetical protein
MRSLTCFLTLGVFAALVVFFMPGCAGVSTSHTQDVGSPKFPPSDPTKIEILREEPTQPHVRLGEVRAEPPSESTEAAMIEDALRKEAAELGADAAVVVYDGTHVTGAEVLGPWWGGTIRRTEERLVIAVAIKYQ